MNQIKTITFSDILLRAVPIVVLALSIMSTLTGCGVRQFGAKTVVQKAPAPDTIGAFGPFYSAGQGSGSMSAGSCASGSGHHPCARARASVGMPYQFDVNPNAVQGPITAGTGFGASAPYNGGAAGTAGKGAGKTQTAANRPRMENRDLHLMKNQAPAADQAF
jgi:hypothetical protein